jgi:hypothetical protein
MGIDFGRDRKVRENQIVADLLAHFHPLSGSGVR